MKSGCYKLTCQTSVQTFSATRNRSLSKNGLNFNEGIYYLTLEGVQRLTDARLVNVSVQQCHHGPNCFLILLCHLQHIISVFSHLPSAKVDALYATSSGISSRENSCQGKRRLSLHYKRRLSLHYLPLSHSAELPSHPIRQNCHGCPFRN